MRRQVDRCRQALCPVAVLVDWLDGHSCETTADLAADAAEGLATARDALHKLDDGYRKLAVAHGASVDASAECITEIAETLRRGYALQDNELARLRSQLAQQAAELSTARAERDRAIAELDTLTTCGVLISTSRAGR